MHLSAWYRGKRVTVPVEAVTHFLADCKYVAAHHPGGVLILTDSLTRLERELPEFIRLHRGVLVRRSLVTGFRFQRINGGRRLLAFVSFQTAPLTVGPIKADQVTQLVLQPAA